MLRPNTRERRELVDQIALCDWSEFLDNQEAALNDAIKRGNGCRLMAQPSDVTFLQIDDRGDRESVDAAVYEFMRTKSWPKLSYSRLRLLLLRAFMARRILGEIRGGEVDSISSATATPVDPADGADMIRWLFIGIWNDADATARRTVIIDFVRSLSQK